MRKTNLLKRVSAIALALVMTGSLSAYVGASEATAAVKKVSVSNLPAKTLTLKKGKSKVLKVAVNADGGSSTAFTFKTSNKKIVAVKKAKGGVKAIAKADGTAKVTIISKANKKKKVAINVTVGTPVTKVSVKKTANVLKGGKLQLTAAISPSNASNKNVVWSTSNKKIATVSSSGLVTGKKKGTVNITATAADGSGKKMTCKVSVIKKNAIQKVEVTDRYTVKLTLAAPQKLDENKITLMKKCYSDSKYVSVAVKSYVDTEDNQVYYIGLEKSISEMVYVQVTVKGLKGVSKKVTVEDLYENPKVNNTSQEIFVATVGEAFEEWLYNYEYTGYQKATASNLPAGIKMTNDSGYNPKFSGTPTQAGKKVSKVVLEDERGNKTTATITWLIGSSKTLVAGMDDEYYTMGKDQERSWVYSYVYAEGGSGSYSYKLVDAGGLKDVEMWGNQLGGYAEKAGTYTVKVKVTDANNASLSTVVTSKIYVKAANTVKVVVKDKNGSSIENAGVWMENTNAADLYSNEADLWWDEEGKTYKGYAQSSTWDIFVSGNDVTKVVRKNISGDVTYTITLPVYTVNLTYPSAIKNKEYINWYNDEDERVGYGTKLHLKKGTYKLHANVVDNFVTYKLTADVKVAGKAVTVAVKTASTVAPQQLTLGVD